MPKILVVDDEPNIIELAKLYLEREDYQVEGVNNGNDAFSRLSSFNPDLVILDLMLPDIDGFEICRQIRDNRIVKIKWLRSTEVEPEEIAHLCAARLIQVRGRTMVLGRR